MILYYRKGDKPIPADQKYTDLEKAIEAARKAGDTLVIGRLGSLRRSHRFIRTLAAAADSGVEFVCHDDPTVTHWTIHDLAETAEQFAQQVSERTREGMATMPASVKIGFQSGHPAYDQKKAIKASAKRRTERARAAYVKLVPLMRQLHREHSFDQVAQLLNEKGHRTIIGTPFNGPTVCRILQRSKS